MAPTCFSTIDTVVNTHSRILCRIISTDNLLPGCFSILETKMPGIIAREEGWILAHHLRGVIARCDCLALYTWKEHCGGISMG